MVLLELNRHVRSAPLAARPAKCCNLSFVTNVLKSQWDPCCAAHETDISVYRDAGVALSSLFRVAPVEVDRLSTSLNAAQTYDSLAGQSIIFTGDSVGRQLTTATLCTLASDPSVPYPKEAPKGLKVSYFYPNGLVVGYISIGGISALNNSDWNEERLDRSGGKGLTEALSAAVRLVNVTLDSVGKRDSLHRTKWVLVGGGTGELSHHWHVAPGCMEQIRPGKIKQTETSMTSALCAQSFKSMAHAVFSYFARLSARGSNVLVVTPTPTHFQNPSSEYEFITSSGVTGWPHSGVHGTQ